MPACLLHALVSGSQVGRGLRVRKRAPVLLLRAALADGLLWLG